MAIKPDAKVALIEFSAQLLWFRFSGGSDIGPVFLDIANRFCGGLARRSKIDIMGLSGERPDDVVSVIHFGQPWLTNSKISQISKETDRPWMHLLHTYAIEWEHYILRWYVVGELYSTINDRDLAPEIWRFEDHQCHLILNLALGGFGGDVDVKPCLLP